MIETELSLKEAKSSAFNSSGEARIRFSPSAVGERWEVQQYSVGADTSNTRCWLYRGSEDTPPLDFTQQGSGDASFIGSIQLRTGDELIFVWRDGVAGDRVQARLEGKRFIPGQRAY